MPRIVIVGAGAGGLAFAIGLQNKYPGFEDFVIYEKGEDVGGTWRDNTYPGCSSDVSVHFYSLSTDLNPEWKHSHGSQSELFQYFRDVTEKRRLYDRIVLNTSVISAVWTQKDGRGRYIITTRTKSKDKGEEENVVEADILISAIGPLEVPRYPAEVSGLETFKGKLCHAGKYDHSVDLKGKRVGVVGNATSAAQIVPTISEDPSVDVTNFCRTASWFVRSSLTKYTESEKWWFRNIPLYMRYRRLRIFLHHEHSYFMVFANSSTRKSVQKKLVKYIKETAPAIYHDKLIPDYDAGCKRLIMDRNGYLQALHRPNVRLNWDGIEAVTETGVKTKTGATIPLDVLIFATGYMTEGFTLAVRGASGETVSEYYKRQGGPQAYMGTVIPGFPNLFILGGPNTGTGHTSFLFTEENQVHYILDLIEPILSNQISTVEVTASATQSYQVLLQKRLHNSVWEACNSWYRSGGNGRVSLIFPGSATLFWWWFRVRGVRWSDYTVGGGSVPRRGTLEKVFLFAIVVLSVAFLARRVSAI